MTAYGCDMTPALLKRKSIVGSSTNQKQDTGRDLRNTVVSEKTESISEVLVLTFEQGLGKRSNRSKRCEIEFEELDLAVLGTSLNVFDRFLGSLLATSCDYYSTS